MDDMPIVEVPNLPKVRFGVLDGLSNSLISKVLVEVISDRSVQLSISGDVQNSDTVLNILKKIDMGASSTSIQLSPDETLSKVVEQVQGHLIGAGYGVEELPLGDMQVEIQIDLSNGLIVGEHKSLHEHNLEDSSLSKKIFDSVAGIFLQASNDLASEIQQLISENNHAGAAEAVERGREGIAFQSPSPALLEALFTIELNSLVFDAQERVRKTRVAVGYKLQRYDQIEDDVQWLLNSEPLEDAKRAMLENTQAIIFIKRGEVEAALSIWRRLVKYPERLGASERGWVWRNMSLALPQRDVKASQAAQFSADAFLEAGDKFEAANSLFQLSKLLEYESPDKALEQTGAMLGIIDQNGLIGSELRAEIHFIRGKHFVALHQWSDALAEARQAIELRRDSLGVEEQLIVSLNLAAISAENCGEAELAKQFNLEAKELEKTTTSAYFAFTRRVEALFANFENATAELLLAEVRAFGDYKLITGIEVAISMHDTRLTDTDRLRRLEALRRELDEQHIAEQDKYPVYLAIASVLRESHQFSRAVIWLRRILENSPLDISSRDMLIDCLWKAQDWGAAVEFLRDEIARHGEKPGLMHAYGHALIEISDFNTAVTVLTKALKLSDSNEDLRLAITDLRERALESGGTVQPNISPVLNPSTPVLRQDIEQALQDYARFVAADKRMVFWDSPQNGEDYSWLSYPEKRAQDLLHTFLKARFHSRISLFEELDTGAGRLDIFLKMDGGLSAIVELKMCGFGYSSSYAAAGEDQIRHYMENRSCHLGYLVVHDARLEGYGLPLIQMGGDGSNTISEIFVDLRPRVSLRKKIK